MEPATSNWPTVELGSIISLRNGYAFKSRDFIDAGVPVIKIKNVKPNKINLNDLSFVSEEIAEACSKHLITPDEILITMSGNRADGSPESWVGKVSRFKLSGRYLLNQRVSAIKALPQKADTDFLAYNLSSWETQLELISQANSSGGQANISPETIRNLKIDLPPLAEQRAIAGVLSSLDDKIDLLHRQNKTLESLAETLFRQWFVEEAEDDWEEGFLGDLLELQRGYDLPAQNRTAGKYPIYAASGYAGGHCEFKVRSPGVTTGRSGVLGNVYFVQEDFWPLNTSLFVKQFKKATPLFSYFLLRELDLTVFNAGSAVPTLNRNHVHEYRLRIPPRNRIEEFEDIMVLNYKKIHDNESQIRTLTSLREALLPKLTSGEVKVEE